ncbi:MAG: phosphatase PAP2 family protein [Bacteroidales bacterium]|nr:phosphatase PAP2 family protein [Bacteroidales bacterium]
MLEVLENIDKQWLLALNNDYTDFWDGLMFGYSAKLTWVPLYLSMIYVIFKKWGNQAWWIIVSLVLCVVIADQVSSGILKGAVQRLRPSRDPELEGLVVLVKNYRGGLYGFVSSHAANSFGLALLSSLLFRNRFYGFAIFSWAAINAYSRIYLGVHYPGDILGGILVGFFAAWIVYWALKKFKSEILNRPPININQAAIPIYVFGLTIIGLVAYSYWIF